jgi:hypothetical protein
MIIHGASSADWKTKHISYIKKNDNSETDIELAVVEKVDRTTMAFRLTIIFNRSRPVEYFALAINDFFLNGEIDLPGYRKRADSLISHGNKLNF